MSLNPRVSNWQGRRVWVVGASTGIGHALAALLLQRGARVALSARNAAKLQDMANVWPGKSLVLPMDVSDEAAWQENLQRLQREWGQLDHLLFCAADYQPVRAWTLDAGKIRSMVNTNLEGAMLGAATVLPGMLRQGNGAISMIASVAGYTGLPKSLVYGPTKAALINFCEALYLDVHDKGLAVHIINPGFVDTPLTQQNDFKMPALISPETAAERILQGFASGSFEIHFPKRFTFWLRLIRRLPYRLRFRLLSRVAENS